MVTDCCGNITSYTLDFGAAACDGPEYTSIILRKTAGLYYIDITFPDCGTDCHSFSWQAVQVGPFASGLGYSTGAINSVNVPCGGGFPYTYTLQAFPNITGLDGQINFSVLFTNCCCLANNTFITLPI